MCSMRSWYFYKLIISKGLKNRGTHILFTTSFYNLYIPTRRPIVTKPHINGLFTHWSVHKLNAN